MGLSNSAKKINTRLISSSRKAVRWKVFQCILILPQHLAQWEPSLSTEWSNELVGELMQLDQLREQCFYTNWLFLVQIFWIIVGAALIMVDNYNQSVFNRLILSLRKL